MKRYRILFIALITAALWIGLLSCLNYKNECALNSDCKVGFVCTLGNCTPECREARDCKEDEECRSGQCFKVRSFCDEDSDCRPEERCLGGVCSKGLVINSGNNNDGNTKIEDKHNYGQACKEASECHTNICAFEEKAELGVCSQECNSVNDCPHEDPCITGAEGKMLCNASPSEEDKGIVGDPCPKGNKTCKSELCINSPGEGPVCVSMCNIDADCLTGFSCRKATNASGNTLSVCLKGTGRGFSDPCSKFSDCTSKLCLGMGGTSSNAYCTMKCSGQNCPRGYTCTKVDDPGTGVSHEVCAVNTRGSSIICSSNIDCSGIGFCDMATQMCVGLCTDNSDCPHTYAICHPQEYRCVQCTTDFDCGGASTCQKNFCL